MAIYYFFRAYGKPLVQRQTHQPDRTGIYPYFIIKRGIHNTCKIYIKVIFFLIMSLNNLQYYVILAMMSKEAAYFSQNTQDSKQFRFTELR
jgi:hypothetical protein